MDLAWTNPTTKVNGEVLATISKIEIRRNEDLIHTFTEAVPGGQNAFSDMVPEDGTYIYTVQCFNEAGGGVPAVVHAVTGSNWVLHNKSNNGSYSDTSGLVSISNDDHYTIGGKTVLTIFQNDSTKMMRISGSSSLGNQCNIEIYAGSINDGVKLPSDTIDFLFPHNCATLVIDIPDGASLSFHYTLECVNSLYEMPDTTIAIMPDSNGIIYVTQEGAGLRNGSSWANATSCLSHALNVADTMADKPKIWVAQGIYYGKPQMINDEMLFAFAGGDGVNVYGGFDGNESADFDLSLRDLEHNMTVLDGILHHSVLYLRSNSEWNGFQIQRGTNGCMIESGSLIKHCVVSDCLNNGVYSTYSMQYGYSSGSVDSCFITHNVGNGINVFRTSITNTTISHNGGDGVRARGNMHHCIITNNAGNGFSCTLGSSGTDYIHHCLVANNDGTGLALGWNLGVFHVTVVNNQGNGITTGSDCSIKNSIIWGNGGKSIETPYSYELVNCAVEGDYLRSSYSNIPLVSAEDTLGFNPGFVSPADGIGKNHSGGDWHLQPTSVCVNHGTANYDNYSDTDLDGNVRIQQGTPDIGAYESAYNPLPNEGKIIYVKAHGIGDGSSWSNATSDLTKAIEIAWLLGSDTRVWVAQGSYPTSGHPFYVKDGLCLMGGFAGDEPADYDVNLRNTLAHATLLDGQYQNRVLHQTYDIEHPAWVDGFTLINGQAEEGAGAYLMSNTTMSKCRVANNISTSEDGMALYAIHDSLKQVIVENNEGLGVMATECLILHCDVVRNSRGGILLSVDDKQQSNSLLNTVIWGNRQYNLDFKSGISKKNSSINYCAIDNYVVDGIGNIRLSSENNAVSGPHYTAPTDSTGIFSILGNWNLNHSSVCLNAGTDISEEYGVVTDMAGQPRVQQERADIGVLESPHNGSVCCRNMTAFIYEGETYAFYDTLLSQSGCYVHRWQDGNVDSVVTLQLIVKHIIYVSVNGAGLKDGSSWNNALDGETATSEGSTKLADVLVSAGLGSEFWIQSGVYYPCSDSDVNKSFVLNEGVAVYGGFAGTETSLSERDTLNPPTVFSGNLLNNSIEEHHSRAVVTTAAENRLCYAVTIDNISISEGSNELHDGSALQINATTIVNANKCHIHHNTGSAIGNNGGVLHANACLIDSNTASSPYYASYMFCDGAGAISNKLMGSVYLKNCKILHNEAPADGAIYSDGYLSIDSSVIAYNHATEGYIGAVFSEGDMEITNSRIAFNHSYGKVSSIACWGSFLMANCKVDHNQSQLCNPYTYFPQQIWAALSGSSHIMVVGNAVVNNCTFSYNNQNAGSGGGCLNINGKADIRNCEFTKNKGAGNSSSSYVAWGDEEDEPTGGGMVIGVTFNTRDNDGGGVHVENGEVYVEDCIFDNLIGMSGTAASVRSGKLTMNRCTFTRNYSDCTNSDEGIISILTGELLVQNSLFANNQNLIFNTLMSENSKTTFSNCTFANNGRNLVNFLIPNTFNLVPDTTSATEETQYVNRDTSHVNFYNCIISGDWSIRSSCISEDASVYCPNYTLDFTNTLFDTLHTVQKNTAKWNESDNKHQNVDVLVGADNNVQVMTMADVQRLTANQSESNLVIVYDAEKQDFVSCSTTGFTEESHSGGDTPSTKDGNLSGCTPDSLGNIYYCDPMFVNPTTVLGVDSVQNPLLYDFRLQDGSPCINSGDTTGLHLTAEATDLAGERRVKQCRIDRGCYEYGTVVYDTVFDELCVEADSLPSLVYTGHGFTIEHPEPGLHFYSGSGTCDPSGTDTIGTIGLMVKLASHTVESHTACDSYEWNGETYTESGDYTVTFTNAAGCDSVVTLHLTVNNSDATDFSVTVYDSYDWNGVTYTESGDYEQTFTNVNGCDSVVTLHLTICTGITTLPYSEDFEDFTESTTAATDVEPTCWELVRTEATSMPDNKRPQLYYRSDFAHSGDYSLLMNYRCIYAMPVLSEETTLQNVKLDMYLRQSNAAYQLEVGVWDDATNTFTRVALFNNTTTGVEHVTCDFSGYSGYGRRIAFRNTLSNGKAWSYSYNYIDDISLTEMVDCSIPLPYSENFDSFTQSTTAATGVEPTCWELVRTDATSMPDSKRPQLYYKSDFAHSGSYSLLMNYRGIYAMPEISEETDIPLNRMKLEMYLKQSNAAYQLEVGVWDDATNTFEPVALFNNTTTGVEHVTCDFSGYNGNGRRIAFRNTLGNGKTWNYSYNYIDDITLTEMEDCSIALPFTETFEDFTESTTVSTGVEPDCWELVHTDASSMPDSKRPQLYYRSDFAHSGDYSLLMNYRCVYAMPEISEETNIPLNRVKLDMYLRQANAAYQLEVGVWDDATNTFTPVALFNNATTGVEHVTCDFSNYSGNGRRVAFRNTLCNGKTWSYSYNYIDDINLALIDNDKSAEMTDANTGEAGMLAADRDMVDILVYPNPTRDFINVQCTMYNVQLEGIEVIDVYGKVVRTVVGANNDSPTQINVSGLAAGMYFVRVTTEEGTVTKAFVKR